MYDPYLLVDDVFRPPRPVEQRKSDYNPRSFKLLLEMQDRHFWYRGRHRFVWEWTKPILRRVSDSSISLIDIGGGCGGWLRYLESRLAGCRCELALGDSCEEALNFAKTVLPQTVKFFHLDLLDLKFEPRWNVVFLLDVLEHVDDDGRALMEVAKALKPGGFAVLTVPALRFFWSFNDELAHHKRRYERVWVEQLARRAELEIHACRSFMFFLSPIYWA